MVVFGQSVCIHGEVVVIRAKVVVIGQKYLYSGKSGCSRQSGCIRAKVVVFGQKWLYSGKVVVFRQKWLYSVKSGCIWAKVVLFGSSSKMQILGEKGKNFKNQKKISFFSISQFLQLSLILKKINKYFFKKWL